MGPLSPSNLFTTNGIDEILNSNHKPIEIMSRASLSSVTHHVPFLSIIKPILTLILQNVNLFTLGDANAHVIAQQAIVIGMRETGKMVKDIANKTGLSQPKV